MKIIRETWNSAQFVGALALSVLLLSPDFGAAAAEEAGPVPIVWSVRLDEAPAVEEGLEFDGEMEVRPPSETRGAPVAVFLGMALIPPLADAIIDVYRNLTQGGVRISLNEKGELEIAEEPNLPYGTYVLQTAAGVEVKTFDTEPSHSELVSAITAVAATVK